MTAATLTLTDFLLARVEEDESTAGSMHHDLCARSNSDYTAECDCAVPSRVLAECAAKRAIVSRCDMVLRGLNEGMFDEGRAMDARDALRALALPHADHPDHRDEWRP